MVIPSTYVEMSHHAIALEAPLYGMGFWLMELWRRGVNDLRGKRSQGTHSGSITVWKEGMF